MDKSDRIRHVLSRGQKAFGIWLAISLLVSGFWMVPGGAVLASEGTDAYVMTDSLTGWPKGPDISAGGAVLMDAKTGAVLYAKNEDTAFYPASITKILTALVCCERLDMADQLVMSEAAAYGIEAGSSSIYADTGERFTVEQAMMALMLESANEIALGLGEKVSGNTKKFTELMNARARAIGCTHSHFNNPHGLTDPNHYVTAMDMALISRAAWRNSLFQHFTTTGYFELLPTNIMKETRYFLNHHAMMEGRDYAYNGVLGGKTGYTDEAGNTLVTYARRGNVTLIAVVLSCPGTHYSDTKALLDYGFENFRRQNLLYRTRDRVTFLPNQAYILSDVQAFEYQGSLQVMLPTGVSRNRVERKRTTLKNTPGRMPCVLSEFTYEGNYVGYAIQYEKDIGASLLRPKAHATYDIFKYQP